MTIEEIKTIDNCEEAEQAAEIIAASVTDLLKRTNPQAPLMIYFFRKMGETMGNAMTRPTEPITLKVIAAARKLIEEIQDES